MAESTSEMETIARMTSAWSVLDTDQAVLYPAVQLLTKDVAAQVVPTLVVPIRVDVLGKRIQAIIEFIQRDEDGVRLSTIQRIAERQPLVEEMIEKLRCPSLAFAFIRGALGHASSLP
jgi:hypothetical protein